MTPDGTDADAVRPEAAPGWPASPEELADTGRCPACFTPTRTTSTGASPLSCSRCGLGLGDARLATVLQAPLVIGAAVLVVHAVAQLWPWIARSYTATPWWLWVGLGGVLLIVIAARYERRLTALRKANANVTALR